MRIPRPLAAVLLALAACSSSVAPYKPGAPLTLDVTSAFSPGTVVRDRSSGHTATVTAGGSVTVTPDASGVVLLEKDGAAPTPFRWKDATVYFAMTDRFANGDPGNDHSYGRPADPTGIGTWHGGDFQGLISKLDYIASLGVTALWISPVVEQVHGWVSGGNGDFKHYGYAGYWALDFTRIDQNFGKPDDLKNLIDEAHQRGIRVLVDVVMNHPGYATGDDLAAYLPEVFQDGSGNAFKSFTPPPGKNWNAWNDLVDYNSNGWVNWWSPSWIRAGFPGFDKGGTDDLTRQLNFLPDFKTESTGPAGVPALFKRKTDTGVVEIPGATVRDYLVAWHTAWVRRYGIDGFRCDTAKNVEVASWKALKSAAVPALREWKALHSSKPDDLDFWMTGEVYGHGVQKDGYYSDGGFDSLINFNFQGAVRDLLLAHASLADGAVELEKLYADMSSALASDPSFDALSYLSSHDTRLFLEVMKNDAGKQRQAAAALLLAPGGVQIFYGDESGRRLGPAGSDEVQGTRSDMNWSSIDNATLAQWQKLGSFRKAHAAVGAGVHQKLSSPPSTYAFSRKLDQDAVVVALTSPGTP
jgi:alpha-amylase